MVCIYFAGQEAGVYNKAAQVSDQKNNRLRCWPRLGAVAKQLLLEFRTAWSQQIRALYSLQFMTKCPKSLHCLQSLFFLLHVLNIDAPSPVLDVQAVASSECFSHSRPLLAHVLANASEFSLLCEPHGMYQVDERYNEPTLKCTPFFAVPGKVLSGGEARTYPKKPDARRVLLRASSFLQTYPNGGLSGGEAIVISCGFRLLQEVVITPGKLINAHIQTRTDRFWVVLAYCHPSSARDDCEALARWLADHQDKSDPIFLLSAILNIAITSRVIPGNVF